MRIKTARKQSFRGFSFSSPHSRPMNSPKVKHTKPCTYQNRRQHALLRQGARVVRKPFFGPPRKELQKQSAKRCHSAPVILNAFSSYLHLHEVALRDTSIAHALQLDLQRVMQFNHIILFYGKTNLSFSLGRITGPGRSVKS